MCSCFFDLSLAVRRIGSWSAVLLGFQKSPTKGKGCGNNGRSEALLGGGSPREATPRCGFEGIGRPTPRPWLQRVVGLPHPRTFRPHKPRLRYYIRVLHAYRLLRHDWTRFKVTSDTWTALEPPRHKLTFIYSLFLLYFLFLQNLPMVRREGQKNEGRGTSVYRLCYDLYTAHRQWRDDISYKIR